jgi:hypothetical protein
MQSDFSHLSHPVYCGSNEHCCKKFTHKVAACKMSWSASTPCTRRAMAAVGVVEESMAAKKKLFLAFFALGDVSESHG